MAPISRVISQLPGGRRSTLERAVFHSNYNRCLLWIYTGFAFPACNASAKITICGFTECLIHHLGIPYIIASDQRPQFTASDVQEWDRASGIYWFYHVLHQVELWACYLYLEIKYSLRRCVELWSWQRINLWWLTFKCHMPGPQIAKIKQHFWACLWECFLTRLAFESPPQCGWAPSNPFRAWTENKRTEEGRIQSLPV